MSVMNIVDSSISCFGAIIIPVTLALIALLWPWYQSWRRRRTFRALILRELEELSPYPEKATLEGWWAHQQKRFIHRDLFAQVSENRDSVLSLEPDLVYYVTQLWQSLKVKDWEQWRYILSECLSKPRYDRKCKIAKASTRWEALHELYRQRDFRTKSLQDVPDYLAPDGSEIRLLPAMVGGGLAHCTLPPGGVSKPIHHRTVEEIWYCLEGKGQVWRKLAGREGLVDFGPGTSLTIPTGTHFQFRNPEEGALQFIIATMPPWPGPEEAVALDEGKWPFKQESEKLPEVSDGHDG